VQSLLVGLDAGIFYKDGEVSYYFILVAIEEKAEKK